ncbi:MAG: bifunctional DNA-formamidopyrimidine glycosylase/DNA-(apurinic or apyrimidinic site) lyase [Kiritimatiellia bacterium]|jgi:formamidopyrimidine-DNA glycosylase|nr:bifunctional DNA-formamidopyrimidine glycosylase/DNA-(apurinic or apyrimidinic site) lyase [Kiritimatiellia bacterium]
MPELPEVETVVRELRAQGMVGAVIRDVRLRWPRIAAGRSPASLVRALRGRTVTGVTRRAKYIVFTLDTGDRLLIHLRMTGKLRFAGAGEQPGPHDHALLLLKDSRRLVFHDTRKFGRFRLCGAGADPFAALGPEPLEPDFTPAALRARLSGKRRKVKPLLLDQSVVAGLGNIYVDESLWHAGIHPERRADSLTETEIRRLCRAIRAVLRRAVDLGGTTLGKGETNFYSVAGRRGRNADGLRVFRRDGLPCPRCGQPIARSVVGQRGTHFCPACQRSPTSP